LFGLMSGRHRLVGHARLSFGVMLVDVGHRACLRFVFGYFWLLLAIDGYCMSIFVNRC
jgi:hypothetical protein